MVVAICDVYIAFPSHLTAMRPVQPSLGGVSTVAIPSLMPAGNRRDDASGGVYAPDGVVFGIYHYYVTLRVAPDGLRRTPRGQQSWAAISGVPPLPGAGQGRHDSWDVNLADPVALPLGNVGIPVAVLADGPGAKKAGFRGWQTIALPDFLSVTRKSADNSAGQVQAAHPLILNIGYQKTSPGVEKAVVRFS